MVLISTFLIISLRNLLKYSGRVLSGMETVVFSKKGLRLRALICATSLRVLSQAIQLPCWLSNTT